MKYRIKIVTYKSGRQEFTPQVKTWLYWDGLDWDGKAGYNYKMNKREQALSAIDLHYGGNDKKQTVIFEYHNKP